MKPFKDYETTQAYSERQALPTGGYVGKIMGAEVVNYGEYSRLLISVDITEGDYAGYYAERYRSEKENPDRKWKGVLRLGIPTDDGSERDSWTKRSFKTAIQAIEDSNEYHWEWDENTLKGKEIGILIRQKEWEYNGKTGWSPEVFKFTTVDMIRAGKFKMPDDRGLNGNVAAGGFTAVSTSADDDLPF